MIGGNLVDNLLMGKEARKTGASWPAIAGRAGRRYRGHLHPAALWRSALRRGWHPCFRVDRRKDFKEGLKSTGGILKGCGFSVVARFSIGIVMILLWAAWAAWL